MMRRLAMVLALWSGWAAADPDPGVVVETMRQAAGAPGAALAYGGAETVVAFSGKRAVGGSAVAADDPWHIGSNTKSMTALVAARLVARGAIGWEDTLWAVRPDLPMHAAYRDVTLIQLLRHQGRLPANPGRRSFARLPRDLANPGPGRQSYLETVLNLPPLTAPTYSNAGYVVAAAMLEQAGGAPWEVLLQREVAGPLGLTTLGFGAPTGPVPYGHRRFLGINAPITPGPAADNPPAMAPAGTVHLSIAEMHRYLRAHLDRDPDYLPPAQWDVLHGRTGGAPLGWFPHDGKLVHSGSNTFWYQLMILDHAKGRAFVASVNSGALQRSERAMVAAYEALHEGG